MAGLWQGLDPQLSGQGTPRSLRPPQTQPPSPASSGNFPPGPRGRRQDQEGRAGAHPTFLAGHAAPPASQLSLRPWARPGPRWAPRGSDSQRMRAPSVSGCVVVSTVTRPPPGATSPVPGEHSRGRVFSPVAPAPAVPARCHLMRPGRGGPGLAGEPGEGRRVSGGQVAAAGCRVFWHRRPQGYHAPGTFLPAETPARICPAAEGAAWVAGGLTPELAQRPLQRPLFPGLRPQGTSRHLEPVPTPQCSASFQARRAAGARLRAWGAPPRSSPPQVRVATAGSRAPGVADGTQLSAATESGRVAAPL